LRPVRVLGALLLTSQSSRGVPGPRRAPASRSRSSLLPVLGIRRRWRRKKWSSPWPNRAPAWSAPTRTSRSTRWTCCRRRGLWL